MVIFYLKNTLMTGKKDQNKILKRDNDKYEWLKKIFKNLKNLKN